MLVTLSVRRTGDDCYVVRAVAPEADVLAYGAAVPGSNIPVTVLAGATREVVGEFTRAASERHELQIVQD